MHLLIPVTASSSATTTATMMTTNNHDVMNNGMSFFLYTFYNMFLCFLTVRLHTAWAWAGDGLCLQATSSEQQTMQAVNAMSQ